MKPLILQHSVSGQNILSHIPIRLSEESMRGSISMVESEIINKAIEYIGDDQPFAFVEQGIFLPFFLYIKRT